MTKKKNKPNKVREYNDWYWGGRVSEEIKDTKINYRKYQLDTGFVCNFLSF